MKIFSICCVRDESDIIRETLERALAWSDKIFVFDNGSVDGTWEIVNDIARERREIVLIGHDHRVFTEELRGEIFEDNRGIASPDDWWCRLDADEIYIDNPVLFLQKVPSRYGFVLSATFNFYFTDVDLGKYNENPAHWLSLPVQQRLRFYQNNWSEGRFVRHRKDLRWEGRIWPANRGRVFPGRIRLKHYQYRSPEQINRRLNTRQRLFKLFPHEANREICVPDTPRPDWSDRWLRSARIETATWKDRVRSAGDCDELLEDGVFVTREELMPPIPSPAIDFLRSIAQATETGHALLWPIRKWRRNRSRPLQMRT